MNSLRYAFTAAFGGSLLVTLASGCAVASPDAEASEGAAVSASSALDAPASHCEFWVDKVATTRGSHGLLRTIVYLKTRNEALAGAGGVEEVGYFGRMTDAGPCNGPECRFRDEWRAYPAEPFVGSDDYFELSFTLAHDYTAPRTFEGAFYVRTTSGLTLWINPEAGGNFFIDRRLASDVQRIQGAFWAGSGPDNAVSTADAFPYVNPARCR